MIVSKGLVLFKAVLLMGLIIESLGVASYVSARAAGHNAASEFLTAFLGFVVLSVGAVLYRALRRKIQ